VLHHRVAGDAGGDDVIPVHPGLVDQLLNDLVDRPPDGEHQLLQSVLVLVGMVDPGDHVLAKGYLGVLPGRRGYVRPILQADQLPHDGRGADVQGHTVLSSTRVPRLQADEPMGFRAQ
jgi:hypothetical protein